MLMDIWEVDSAYAKFTSDYIFRDKDILMTVPGVAYRAKQDAFVAPLTWALCVAARGVFGASLELSVAVQQWAWNEVNTRVNPSLDLRLATDAPVGELYEGDEALFPFQRAGVKFLSLARRAILGDDMGSGKTIQAIATMRTAHARGERVFPALVVAPSGMVLTWEAEIHKWFPEARVGVVKGTKAKRDKMLASDLDIFVINWELVRMHSRLAPYGSIRLKRCHVCEKNLPETNKQASCEACDKELNKIKFATLIVDEAHRLKSPKAKQTRAVWAVGHSSDLEYCIAMSGTPIADAPDDFWSILHLVHPQEHPSRTKFIDRYCATSFNPWSGGLTITGLARDTMSELFSAVDPRMRRMPKEVVLPFLPKKVYSTRYADMPPRQAKAYQMMAEQMIAITEEGVPVIATNELSKLTRLSQFASSMVEMVDNEIEMVGPSNKVDALIELLEEMDQEPLVVFALHRQLIELAAARLLKEKISYSMIVGGQTMDEREQAKQAFQNGEVRVVLCTLGAGGVGITLTRSNTLAFLEMSWSNIDNKQAEDRVHRIGSEIHDKVHIIDIIAPGTVEVNQRATLERKKGRLEEIVRDKDTITKLIMGQGE